jgi:hypothetical protein
MPIMSPAQPIPGNGILGKIEGFPIFFGSLGKDFAAGAPLGNE